MPLQISAEERAEAHKELFYTKVRELPHRGGGLDVALIGACNTGINAGIPPHEIHAAITLERGQELRPGELDRALKRAIADSGGTYTPIHHTPRTPEERTRERINQDEAKKEELNARLALGEIPMDAPELWEASEPRPQGGKEIPGMPGAEALPDILSFLKTFYTPEEKIYIGNKMENQASQAAHVLTVEAWIKFFTGQIREIYQEQNPETQRQKIIALGNKYPQIIPNPLTGERDETARTRPQDPGSLRSGKCVSAFRFIVMESDDLPLEKQIPLFRGLHLPIYTLTFSGSKSIHALVSADAICKAMGYEKIKTLEDWNATIKAKFFKNELKNIKIDHATSNPDRLSRTPGMYRADKGAFQRTIYNHIGAADIWTQTNKYL